MIIPVPRKLTHSSGNFIWIFPRKGGGGGGKGSSSGKSSSGSSSSRGSGGSKGSFSVSSSGKGSFGASSSSRGGGTPTLISGGSPFAGRLSGGATRDHVYGSSRIGSGYPYGGYGTFYNERPFPYAFYPIYVSPGYYGGDEYGPTLNDTRPGGSLSTAIVLPPNNASQNSYYLVGDETSVSMVIATLVSQCGIVNSTVTNTYINGTTSLNGTVLVPHPEKIVQYYRASSFALALSTYNNSASLPSRAPASNDTAPPPLSEDTPLPSGLNMTLLACLNSTIASTVPLVDTGSGNNGLTTNDIVEITMGSLVGVMMLVTMLFTFCGACCSLVPRTKFAGH